MRSLEIRSVQVISATEAERNHRTIAYTILISLAVVAPALFFGIPSNIDLSNHFRFALPFTESVQAGNYYPGWLAESNHGFGDPSFRFYPPALYYLLTLTTTISGSWYGGTLLTFGLLSVCAGLGMYFWARSFLKQEQAMLASALFAVAPYHLNELYQATLLAEYAGCAVLPFIFAFAERLRSGGGKRMVAGLASTYALLVLTHLPLAVIASTALTIYLLARPQNVSRMSYLLKFAIAIALGLTASAVYWTTMVYELNWIAINKTLPDSLVDYQENFLLSSFSPENMNVWWMNILALLTLLLFVPALLLYRNRLQRPVKTTLLLACCGLVMMLPISLPVWRLLPPMQQIQFPWRWLTIVSVAGALLAGAGLPKIGQLSSIKRLLLLGAMLVSVTFSFSHIVREAQYLNRDQFNQMLATVRGTASVNYWFPVWASVSPRQMDREVEVNGRSVLVDKWEPETRRFTVTEGSATTARIRTFYYPHWSATMGQKKLPVKPDTDGALLIQLPRESVAVDLNFSEPRLSGYSAVASGVGWLLILACLAPAVRRPRIDYEHTGA